jgi:hypothetical protein
VSLLTSAPTVLEPALACIETAPKFLFDKTRQPRGIEQLHPATWNPHISWAGQIQKFRQYEGKLIECGSIELRSEQRALVPFVLARRLRVQANTPVRIFADPAACAGLDQERNKSECGDKLVNRRHRMKLITATKLGTWAGLFLGSALMVRAVPVTFQVNMEIQTGLGTFVPGSHTVELHGSFDGWGPGITLSASPENANVYQEIVDLTGAPGSEVQYKYVINQAGTLVWENDGLGPGGAQNRAVTVPAAEQTLPVVYFNNQSTPPGTVPVTFRVNMGIQEQLGNFDPAMHTVEARGSFDNWGAGIMLSANPTNAALYEGTAVITGSAGTVIEHKYVINQAGTLVYEGNVGPGGPFGNRTFVLASSDQTLPIVYFNNLTNNPGAGIPVTFRVNMGVQIARGNFDPTAGTVTLAGPFNNWSTSATTLTNSPTETNVWLGTVNITTASPGGSVPFKFLMNGTWETGDDRTFILASSAQTLPIEYFDRVPDLGPLALNVAFGVFDVQVTVTWTGGPRVRLQSRTNLTDGEWQDVPDSQGQSEMTFVFELDAMPGNKFFRLIGP